MRFTSAVVFAAATAPLAVSAKGKLGFAIGVRHKDNSCKNQQDFEQDLKTLKAANTGAVVVRTYAAVDGGANDIGGPPCKVPGAILPAAKSAGIQVLLGLWADSASAYETDKEETLKYAEKYASSIYGFTIGSEGLYRQEQKEGTGYDADFILDKINDFKKSSSSLKKPVGTADSWNKYDDGTADPLIQGGVTFLLVNAFGYWQSQDIKNASHTYLDDLSRAYAHIQDVAGSTTSIELWNGETGWPTDGGSDYHDDAYEGTAVAGTENAKTFYTEGVCAALDWNFNVFYFEAFAEPWKPASKGLNGREGDETHWGAFDADRNPLIDFSCEYSS